mgnify:CR=1 FL=1
MEQFAIVAFGLVASFVVGVVTGWWMRYGYDTAKTDQLRPL